MLDRFVLFALLCAALTSSAVTGLGAALPFLRRELTMGYTESGMHSSAYALGVILAGLLADRCIRRWGALDTLRGSAAALGLSMIQFVLAGHPHLTMGTSLVMGFCAAMMSTVVIAALAARPPEERRTVYTRVSVMGVLAGALVPFLVGWLEDHDFSWRLVPMLGVVGLALVLAWTRQPGLMPEAEVERSWDPLPAAFWACWGLLLLAIAVEFCMIFWSATLVEKKLGLRMEEAAGAATVFLFAMLLGRGLGGSWLRRWTPAAMLLLAMSLTIAGFASYWLGRGPLATYLGLFLTGLGLANLYPVLVTLAMGAAADRTAAASARVSLAAGLAIFVAPFVLAYLGETYGLVRAQGFVAGLLALLAVGMGLLHREGSLTRT